ncbi:collagenase-like protein with putative collagen-binding domain [Flavobacteriaceae bacterium MAR_2009_75]|nr:collagenase-like protein with putative collagen-binding domain [Flavobacteriaceae bacterium MAR_2009_75]
MSMRKLILPMSLVMAFLFGMENLIAQSNGSVDGELKKWHPITITFDGPEVSETDAYNPFLGFRLNVTFRHESGRSTYVVPGYFAADGNAAETSATKGNKWRVHFTPNRTGIWNYTISFRKGEDIAVNLSSTAGEPLALDGTTGSINISDTDKSGRDHRGKGVLRYVGENFLRFDNGEWFMKGGADAPETLLAYHDFDGTYLQTEPSKHSYDDELLWGSSQHKDHRGAFAIKKMEAHIKDWKNGDPIWQGNKGKGLIGGLNYLSNKGMNAFSFLTMTAGGDGKNVWPWINHKEHTRYDVSKLAQWEIVFSHADKKGLFIHFKTHETENDQLLDGGSLGPARKLYYRELVARFAHHHALNWNLAEEHDLFQELQDTEMNLAKADAKYIHAVDPYHHPVVIHTYPNRYKETYSKLEGFEYMEGASVQTSNMRPWDNFDRINTLVENANESGRKWVISLDEPGSAGVGVSTDDWDDNFNQDDARTVYWATIAAGGAGIEWYFGYREEQNDIVMEDWRSRDALWDYTHYAIDFYKSNKIPFWRMENANNLTRSEKDFVFADSGNVYVIYLPDGGASTLNLENHSGSYSVEWYNPRKGGKLQQGRVLNVEQTYSREPKSALSGMPNVKYPNNSKGNISRVSGPGYVSLGIPPVESEQKEDWVILVRKR